MDNVQVHLSSSTESDPSHPHAASNINEHSTTTSTPPPSLITSHRWFKDVHGRVAMLRGVNFSGASKSPAVPHLPSHESKSFFNHREVSFVNRPVPLDEADEHFQRLHHWGFRFLRFQVSWEAIEHSGPRNYDTAYLDYVAELLKKAHAYGFKCFLDPHQDVWSRMSGGSGAPGWTLEMVGFDVEKLHCTAAATVHSQYPNPETIPRMIWSTNYFKLACATMFTLFFGGDVFAPKYFVQMDANDGANDTLVVVEGATRSNFDSAEKSFPFISVDESPPFKSHQKPHLVSIQSYLQTHFINAMKKLVERLGEEEGLLGGCVVGFDTMNEPSGGYLGVERLEHLVPSQDFKQGATPTPFQGMLMGSGLSVEVDIYEFGTFGPSKIATQLLNPTNASCWKQGRACVWREHGVYKLDTLSTGTLLRSDYFHRHPSSGAVVDWQNDFWKPYVRSFTATVRSAFPDAVIFIEPPINEPPPVWLAEDGDPVKNISFAPHWYDGLTLVNKNFTSLFTIDYVGFKRGKYSNILFSLSFGLRGIKRNFTSQLQQLREEGSKHLGCNTPCIIGEFGIPFDMNNKRDFQSHQFPSQLKAMDANMTAMERNLLNFTLWNYCPDNSNTWGDQWNCEDLSIFSRDTQGDGDLNAPPPLSTLKSKSAQITDGVVMVPLKTFQLLANDKLEISLAYKSPPSSKSVNLDRGGRAISAFVRPYPIYTAGIPKSIDFSYASSTRTFKFTFDSSEFDSHHTTTSINRAQSEIFIPRWHFGTLVHAQPKLASSPPIDGAAVHSAKRLVSTVTVSDGSWSYDETEQLLHYTHNPQFQLHTVMVQRVNQRWKMPSSCSIM